MKKINSFIFSRVFIISFFIITQAILIGLSFLSINMFWPYFSIIIKIVDASILIRILIKDEDILYKVPWIILIMILPLFGIFIYFWFYKNRLSKIFTKRYNQKDYLPPSSEKDDSHILLSKMIYNMDKYPLYKACKLEYFESGEAYFKSLYENIKKAERYIFLEFFIIKEGIVLNKIIDLLKEKKDLDIRIIYDDFASCNYLSTKTINLMKEMNIKIIPFNKYNPVLSQSHNNRDHRKIAIIDGKKAYTGGINIADEYANITNPYGYFRDSGILIEGEAVKSFVYMYIKMYNAIFGSIDDYNDYVYKSSSNNILLQPFSDGPRPYYLSNLSESIINNLIYNARKSINITTPYLILTKEMKRALKIASYKNIEVNIVTPFIPDKKIINLITKNTYKSFKNTNIKIYEYKMGFIHSKEIIVDCEVVLTGTINLDYRSLIHHFECGVVIYDKQVAKTINNSFQEIINNSVLIHGNEIKFSFLKKIFISFVCLFAPLL